jgi:hypothetical protein
MDIEVWDRLTPNDQSLVAALIAQLPVFMDHVRSDSRSIYRNWDDWIKLAVDVHNILLMSTGWFASDDESTDGSDAAVEDVEFVDVEQINNPDADDIDTHSQPTNRKKPVTARKRSQPIRSRRTSLSKPKATGA